MTKAVEELEYDVLVPSYIPAEFELEQVIYEGDLFLLTYSNADNTSYVEISQRQYARALHSERLLEYTEKGVDPYEANPDLSYQMIDNFVGEYKLNDHVNGLNLSYEFIPAIPKTEIDWYPFYRIVSVGIDEEEFQKVIKSLE
ncbi:hypothetical protein KH400_12970 [Desertibacillus haloalkaliphilus]|nr:hypothetical protein [Desertibacillus haloalkaliphilus]